MPLMSCHSLPLPKFSISMPNAVEQIGSVLKHGSMTILDHDTAVIEHNEHLLRPGRFFILIASFQ